MTSCGGIRKEGRRRETDCIMSKLFDAITKLLAKGRSIKTEKEKKK